MPGVVATLEVAVGAEDHRRAIVALEAERRVVARLDQGSASESRWTFAGRGDAPQYRCNFNAPDESSREW